jgi:Leucine-rich repeat (LRR) protein
MFLPLFLLTSVSFSRNLLGKIPFTAVVGVRSLKTLDFSYNRIEQIEDSFTKRKMNLDKLLLQENNVHKLGRHAFSNFKWINYTSLRGNPLHTIQVLLIVVLRLLSFVLLLSLVFIKFHVFFSRAVPSSTPACGS